MHWYEDDALWSAFAATMFPPARAGSAAALVASSPLPDFPPGTGVQVPRDAHESPAPGGRLLVDVMGEEVPTGRLGRPKAVDLPDAAHVVQRDTVLGSRGRLVVRGRRK
nr:hypothetical protein [Streptomyces sp. CS131]